MRIHSSAIARNELEDEMGGATFTKNCDACYVPQQLHVNDVNARPSKKLLLIVAAVALILGLSAALALWERGWVAKITFVVPYLLFVFFRKEQEKEAHAFNNYRINRK